MTRRVEREVIYLLVGLTVGAVTVEVGNYYQRQPAVEWNYAFYYAYNDKKAVAIKPDGKIEFGPAYTADTLRQLLDGLKSMRQQSYGTVDCHETGWRLQFGDDAKNGVIRP